jgi:hypothetical protein
MVVDKGISTDGGDRPSEEWHFGADRRRNCCGLSCRRICGMVVDNCHAYTCTDGDTRTRFIGCGSDKQLRFSQGHRRYAFLPDPNAYVPVMTLGSRHFG